MGSRALYSSSVHQLKNHATGLSGCAQCPHWRGGMKGLVGEGFADALGIEKLGREKLHGGGVHAVAEAGGGGAVVEEMTEVGFAAGALDCGAFDGE